MLRGGVSASGVEGGAEGGAEARRDRVAHLCVEPLDVSFDEVRNAVEIRDKSRRLLA